jgi:hypothetical protein
MRLPLYALQLLGLTLNRSSQRKRNSHVHVIYSCYNLLVRTILQMKESPQLTSFHQVTSPQINSCDEYAQHAYTPQTSQWTIKISLIRMSHFKELSWLDTFEPILYQPQPMTLVESLSHRKIIHKSTSCTLPHPISHTKGERTPPNSQLGMHSSHRGWIPTILGQLLCWIHPSPRTNYIEPLENIQTLSLSSWWSIHRMTQQNHIRNQTPRRLTQPLKLGMCILHCPLHHNDLSKVPHEIFRNIPLDTSMFSSKYSLVHHRNRPSRFHYDLCTSNQLRHLKMIKNFFESRPLESPSILSVLTMEIDCNWTTKSIDFPSKNSLQNL